MYSPSIFHFSSPESNVKFTKITANCTEDVVCQNSYISNHHFNRKVILHLPDTPSVPATVLNALTEDTSFYRIKNINLVEFCKSEFVEAFVQQGDVYGYSCDTLLDIENGAVFLPSGKLFISLDTFTYNSLGIAGKLSVHILRKPKMRYVVEINTRAPGHCPTKNLYKRILKCLTSCSLQFDFLLTWIPKDVNICPSSIAKYFHNLQCNVTEEFPYIHQNLRSDVSLPVVKNFDRDNQENLEKFLEWIGLQTLNVDLNSEANCNLVSLEQSITAHLCVASVEGFYTPAHINKLIKILRTWLLEKKSESVPWVIMTVYGPPDCLISWAESENSFRVNGDNFCTLVMDRENVYIFTVEESRRPIRFYPKSSNNK